MLKTVKNFKNAVVRFYYFQILIKHNCNIIIFVP